MSDVYRIAYGEQCAALDLAARFVERTSARAEREREKAERRRLRLIWRFKYRGPARRIRTRVPRDGRTRTKAKRREYVPAHWSEYTKGPLRIKLR